ncbi:LytTR family DNA-binding domain-containing protein [uncultured Psychroserpens sp.]|uniref:LytR/AlgR family response regulator transcription factor n=1 Tax=uncultured Psychroserpens sp. TaxID=255436 RepID=UPI00261352A6|nr:response regulator transcription factor [uncultured Psychroserpens sp.]
MTRTYIIIDDEPLAHKLIEKFCDMLPHLELKQNCYNALEAMAFLNSTSVDLMFLDLNMPKLTGFEFLKTLTNPPKVIVTTAYKEFALEGYELNISDYLLKPFSFERFVKAVNKAIGSKPPTVISTKSTSEHINFFVKGDKKHHQIKSEDILYIEAYGNYTKLYFEDTYIVSHESISQYIDLLSSTHFLRVHKSFIIAIDKINQIEGNVIQISKYKIPIGRTYKSIVSKLYNS